MYAWRRVSLIFGLLLVITAFFGALAQQPEVNITPRPAAKAPVPETAVDRHVDIRVDTTMVLIPVSVTTMLGTFVASLDKENFRLYEDKVQQEILSFSSQDAAMSIGIVCDTSGSMGEKLKTSREAVAQFLKVANPVDEFFLIQFNDRPELAVPFTHTPGEILDRMMFAQSKGMTALLDGVYMAMNQMRKAKNPRKAILIISDGGDNHSRYTEGEIKSLVKEADVLIYAIGIYDHYFATPEEQLGPALLGEVTDLTGGRAFTIDNPNDLADVATKIGIELRNQYVIGYRPKNRTHDGKWRKIRVKLIPPKGLPPLRVYAKTGYYAPSE
jgi:Ca-activated chloride channel family protein